jgi:plastocyanin
MAITLNGTTGITTPASTVGGSAVLTTASSLASANLTGAVAVDASGRVTMPYQPAFMSAGVGATVTLSNGGEVICSTVVFNRGSHYNNTTGRFTAPISGIYMFTYVAFNPDGGNKQFAPKLNGSDFGFGDTFGIFDTGPSAPNQVKGLSILINLSANDSMSFGFRNGYSGTVYLGHSYFGGYLIG